MKERNAQVSIMDEIYKGATTVVAWLGESTPYSLQALGAIHRIVDIPEDQYRYHNTVGLDELGIPENELIGLVGLLRRAWFTRVWVVQEVLLARRLRILWGPYEIPYHELVRTAQYLAMGKGWLRLTKYAEMFSSSEDRAQGNIKPLGASIGAFTSLKTGLASGKVHPTLLMSLGRGSDATDQRDHVYGLFGVLKASNVIKDLEHLLPDYSKSVHTVFLDWARTIIRNKGLFYLLSTVEDRSCRSHAMLGVLPSWVPDLSVSMMPLTLMTWSGRQWNASGDSGSSEAIATEDGVLHLQGTLFDTISTVAVPFYEMEKNHEILSMLNLIRHSYKDSASCTAFTDTLWRSLIADGDPLNPAATCAPPYLAQAFMDWLTLRLLYLFNAGVEPLEPKSHLPASGHAYSQSEVLSALSTLQNEREAALKRLEQRTAYKELFLKTMEVLRELQDADSSGVFRSAAAIAQTISVLTGDSPEKKAIENRMHMFTALSGPIINMRRPARTEGDYIGVVPQSALVGDQVWILLGATVPYILRPTTAEGRFEFIGEAYVHGAMRGEAVRGETDWKNVELV